jgi:hypothetical protein
MSDVHPVGQGTWFGLTEMAKRMARWTWFGSRKVFFVSGQPISEPHFNCTMEKDMHSTMEHILMSGHVQGYRWSKSN